MDIPTLRKFFGWCTIIDLGFLVLAFFILALAGDLVYQMQSWPFPITKEAFDVVIHCWIGLLKIVVIMFNLVPWISLVIIDKARHL